MPAVLGLDVGTTTVKAVVIGEDGRRKAVGVSAPIPLLSVGPGHAEQDPEAIWEAVGQALREAGSAAHDIDAVAVAAQSGSLVALGPDGLPLGRLITWMDRRAEVIVEEWQRSGTAEVIRAISGWSAAPGLGLPLIAWMARFEPDTFAAARNFAGAGDLITHRLTGLWTTNPSNAAGLQLIDLKSAQWSAELCALAGINPDQLSSICSSGEIIGRLSREAAAATSLPEGIAVVNGGHDQTCAAFGLGITEPGQVMVGGGTAWVVTAATDKAWAPPHLSINHHVVLGRFTVSKALGYLGAEVEEKAGPAIRAVLEEPAITGVAGDLTIVATGGFMQDPDVPQMLADLTGFPIRVPVGDAWPAMGAARLAGSSTGLVAPEKMGVEFRQVVPQ
jgi:sugar (pentulose or hexulose) kinase